MKGKSLFLLMGATVLGSCMDMDKTDDLKLPINASLPLGNYYLDDRELFEQTALKNTLEVNDEGVFSIQESTESQLVDPAKMDDLFTIEDQHVDHRLSGLSVDGDIPDVEMDFDLSVSEGQRIDRLVLRGGTVVMQEDAALAGVRCTVRELTLPNGEPVVLEPGRSVSLDGAVMEPFHSETVANGLTFVYSGHYAGSSADAEVRVDFENMEFEEITGYIGRKELDETRIYLDASSEAVEFFEQIDEIYLADPYVEFRIRNDLEIPVAVILRSLQVNGREIVLQDGFDKNRFLIEPGESVVRFDNGNTESGTGISDAIGRDFSRVELIVETIVNPTKEDLMDEGYVPGTVNIFRYDSELLNRTLFVLPLDGCLEGFSLESDFDFNLDMEDYMLNQVQLAVTGENGFPLDLSLQLISVDKYTHEETVLNEMPVEIGPANDVKPEEAGFEPYRMDASNFQLITLNKEQTDAFVNAEKIYFKLKASTRNAAEKENVKIYEGSYLDLRLTIGVNGEIEL